MTAIPFIDLAAQRRRLGARLDRAMERVLDHGGYILGPEVQELERRLAGFCGARHAIGCANGTDALVLALMAKGVGAGDAVLVPSFTFAASAEAVVLAGATPVFIEVGEDFNLCPASLETGLETARAQGLRPVAAVVVDLFGQAADYGRIGDVCAGHGLWTLADAAQSFGGIHPGGKVGTLGTITTTSFFPAKPLGCYGDGGALFTDDDDLARTLRSLRVHGQGGDKYDNVRVGLNSRLDTLQAAILLEKLEIFPDEIEARNRVAERYARGLGDVVAVPVIADGVTSVWAQYTVRVGGNRRDRLAARLKDAGVPTAVYYPKPLHRQTAYRAFPSAGSLPVSDRLSAEVLSLPMHPYLEPAVQDRIIRAVRDALPA
jgi:dTDP-4-amino-4,6-dideoxygalactose transaminase